jgi:hypothetical protein
MQWRGVTFATIATATPVFFYKSRLDLNDFFFKTGYLSGITKERNLFNYTRLSINHIFDGL